MTSRTLAEMSYFLKNSIYQQKSKINPLIVKMTLKIPKLAKPMLFKVEGTNNIGSGNSQLKVFTVDQEHMKIVFSYMSKITNKQSIYFSVLPYKRKKKVFFKFLLFFFGDKRITCLFTNPLIKSRVLCNCKPNIF